MHHPSPILEARKLERLASSVLSVGAALPREEQLTFDLEALETAFQRGFFTPEEDDLIRERFAQYITVRAALHETLAQLRPHFVSGISLRIEQSAESRQAYVIAFAASAILMRAATFLIDQFSTNKTMWRKLDEAEPRYGLPRKKFTEIYQTVTRPSSIWTFDQALKRFDELRPSFDEMEELPSWLPTIIAFAEAEREWHRPRFNRWSYVERRWNYRIHSWSRRNRSSWEYVLFAMMEWGGRTASRMRNPFHKKRVRQDVIGEIQKLMQPGDVLVTRHDDAMTNLFLPGFWPHVALCIGSAKQRMELGIELEVPQEDFNGREIRILEAKKDGVRYRATEETLSVDAFVLIRPKLQPIDLKKALERSMSHEGKLYDFNFNFTEAERLVCTEVVYRGFDQIGDLRFELSKRSGRMNLAAEDVLTLAVKERGYEVVGAAGLASNHFVQGEIAKKLVAESFTVG